MKLFRSLLVVGLAALLPLLPVTAQAQQYKQDDLLGDVERIQYPHGPVPDRAEDDITSITSFHRSRFVRVEIAFRQLTRTGEHHFSLALKLSHDRLRHVDVWAERGLWRGKAVFMTRSRSKIPCGDRIRHHIDYLVNQVVVRVPRSCLGFPRWVRVAGEAGTWYDSGLGYWDLGGRAGLGANPVDLVFSPRLRRG